MAAADDRELGSELGGSVSSMKVDFVIPSLSAGGSERQLVGLASRLKGRGVDMQVLVFRGAGALEHELGQHGVPIQTLGREGEVSPIHLAAYGHSLLRIWTDRRPDAIQAWLPEAQIAALPVARLLGVPCRVMALRSLSGPVQLSWIRRLALRLASASATRVTGNSVSVVDDYGWPLGKATRTVIRNGVELPHGLAEAGATPARGVVVANLTAIKGHNMLFQALSQLASPPQISLVGTGPLFRTLHSEVCERGLNHYVSFNLGVTDPLPLLLESQFFVLPSLSEGLPNAVMEASAAGLPVITFRVGGIPEIVIDGVTGILVEPGDIRGLARAIRWVVDNPDWRARAGAAGRKAMEALSWDSMVQRNLDIMNGRL